MALVVHVVVDSNNVLRCSKLEFAMRNGWLIGFGFFCICFFGSVAVCAPLGAIGFFGIYQVFCGGSFGEF